jgi:hypothetical protein
MQFAANKQVYSTPLIYFECQSNDFLQFNLNSRKKCTPLKLSKLVALLFYELYLLTVAQMQILNNFIGALIFYSFLSYNPHAVFQRACVVQ